SINIGVKHSAKKVGYQCKTSSAIVLLKKSAKIYPHQTLVYQTYKGLKATNTKVGGGTLV
ncbi:MAG: hypothetical protein ACK49Q_07950, partial [Burkholderiales bacterium]